MKEISYADQLRQLRALEKAKSKDYTEQAMEVQRLRQQTIEAGPGTPEQKAAQVVKSVRLWTVFMEREFPAQG